MFKKYLISAVLWMAMAISAMAAGGQHYDVGGVTALPGVAPIYLYNSLGEQYITATQLQSATPLTVPPGATIASICVETSGVRYRERGAPTATVGMPAVGTATAPFCFNYAGPLSTVQFIAINGSPTMDVFYYANN